MEKKKILIIEDEYQYRALIAAAIHDLGEISFYLKDYKTISPEEVAEMIKKEDYSFCKGKMPDFNEAEVIEMINRADLILLDMVLDADGYKGYTGYDFLPYCANKQVIGISSQGFNCLEMNFIRKNRLDEDSVRNKLRELVIRALSVTEKNNQTLFFRR